jgi:hypothetical protein
LSLVGPFRRVHEGWEDGPAGPAVSSQ